MYNSFNRDMHKWDLQKHTLSVKESMSSCTPIATGQAPDMSKVHLENDIVSVLCSLQ